MEDPPYESYTLHELQQLKELNVQSFNHYKKLLDDTKTMATLKEGDRMALNLCFAETEKELKLIEEAISKK